MSKKIIVRATNIITKKGRLVNRKSFVRIISPKIKLSKAKERVKALNKALEKVRNLTVKNVDNLEYATAINKTTKVKNVPIIEGYITNQNTKAVVMPKSSQKRNWLIHSHPDNTPLSTTDILAVKPNGTVFNITKDGSIYRSTRKADKEKILKEYETMKAKLKESMIVKNMREKTKFINPNIDNKTLSEDIALAVQHKLLSKLNEKGLITYRAKLKPGSKRIIDRYPELNDIELKKCFIGNIEFNKNSKYYISKNKWNKIPKAVRKEIRKREEKYNNNYKLAVKKDKKLKSLYRSIGIK